MKKDYIAEKEAKKRTTKQGMWFLAVFLIIFIFTILRLAMRSSLNGGFFASMPSESDAYQVATSYVRPTLASDAARFPKDDFQCTKVSDSVYVVKSFVEPNPGVQNSKTNFTIRMRYNGGVFTNERNWTVLNLQEY